MNATSKLAALCGLALAASLAVSAGTAHAEGDETGWITVRAPRVDRLVTESRGGVAPTEVVSLTHRVDYRGLDLAMHSDVRELYRLINESAETACAQLAALSPLADLDTQSCERQARQGAWAQAQKVIDEAIRGS